MLPRWKKKKPEELMEFEHVRIIGLREGGYSYRATAARVQRKSSNVIQVRKKWTDEHRTTGKTGSGYGR